MRETGRNWGSALSLTHMTEGGLRRCATKPETGQGYQLGRMTLPAFLSQGSAKEDRSAIYKSWRYWMYGVRA